MAPFTAFCRFTDFYACINVIFRRAVGSFRFPKEIIARVAQHGSDPVNLMGAPPDFLETVRK
jgi:hypothetical protein